MKWRKIGRVFDPTQHDLSNNCTEFAQSPQSLVFDDFVRIYFSTREKDAVNGKYLSHISYIDMRKDFKEIFAISSHCIIPLGKLGCFDEHGIFPMNVLKVNNRTYAFTCGWNRKVSVSVDTSIGMAISDDSGKTFQKIGDGPILTSSPNEPFLIGDPFVNIYENVFHMWYIYGSIWKRFGNENYPDRVYKIGHAISRDGINWNKEEGRQIISDRLGPYECQANPTVIKLYNRYHMFFCYRQAFDFRMNRNRAYRIGYAFSDNLIDWVRDDENVGIDVSEDDWDSDMMCYPHVFACDGNIYLLYNGNEFGRYGFGLAVLE